MEDLPRETFPAAHRILDSFRGDSSIRTWLTAILKNKIRDYFKKSGREENYEEPESTAVLGNSFASNGSRKRVPETWERIRPPGGRPRPHHRLIAQA